jgi:hypothetical protein
MMYVAHLFHWMSLSFSVVPENIDALVQSWHKFESSVVVADGFLCLQPLTKRHLRFLIGVPYRHEFKNSVAIDIGFLRSRPLNECRFPLPQYCGICDFRTVAWAAYTEFQVLLSAEWNVAQDILAPLRGPIPTAIEFLN